MNVDINAVMKQYDEYGAENAENTARISGGAAGLAVALGSLAMPTVGFIGCFLYSCWDVSKKVEDASLNRFKEKEINSTKA